MARVAYSGWLLAAAVGAAALPAHAAALATGEDGLPRVAEASRALDDVADMTLRFVQEDSPESGHVRVELTPETRRLTIIEARSAAEQGFLAALEEPALRDSLTRVTVVVRLMPLTHPDPAPTEHVVIFVHKGGSDWSVLSGN
jgi:hypothetical protein